MTDRPPLVLDVASGARPQMPNLVRLDAYAPEADVRWDALKFPYPFDAGTFDVIQCRQFIEHIPTNGSDPLWPLLREFGRILKPGGVVELEVPSATCPINMWTNPLHRRAFTPRSFDFLNGRDDSVQWEIGVLPFTLKHVKTWRHVQLGGFDSSYHIPKYLRFNPNIGHVRALRFTLQRTS